MGHAVKTRRVGGGIAHIGRQRHGRLRHEGEVPGPRCRSGLDLGQVGGDMAAVVFADQQRIALGHDDAHGHGDGRHSRG
jgi:hypothetical protein